MFISLQLLHHLGYLTVNLHGLTLDRYVLHTHGMGVDNLPLGALQLFLQSFDLLQQLFVVPLLCLNVLLRIGRNQ
jgi:hypothetical protein